MRAPHGALIALCVLAAACGGADEAGGGSTTSTGVGETTAPTTIAPTEAATTTMAGSTTTTTIRPTTTTTETPDLAPVETLAGGLLCRDLAAIGYPYEAAAWYWIGEGSPDRMDADGNGVPCETVYSGADVAAFWAGPLIAGWEPIRARWTVEPGCCAEPTTGPPSPAGPIPPDAWPADGFYSAAIEGVDEATLTLAVRRWVTCDVLPDACIFDWPGEALTTDPASEVERSLRLTDPDVSVVVRPINGATDGRFGALQGTGSAFATLIEVLESSPPLVEPWFGWPDAVQGPYGTYLTQSWWITTLEVRDGEPVLWVWAGQIAG